MVSIIEANKKMRTVDVKLTVNDIFDIINGLVTMVGNKEEEMNRLGGGDMTDRAQYTRYQKCLMEMQNVKGLIK
jgi:hypothetical protein